MKLVRVCPVCDTENPPEQVHCLACASLLADVDFVPARQTKPVEEIPAREDKAASSEIPEVSTKVSARESSPNEIPARESSSREISSEATSSKTPAKPPIVAEKPIAEDSAPTMPANKAHASKTPTHEIPDELLADAEFMAGATDSLIISNIMFSVEEPENEIEEEVRICPNPDCGQANPAEAKRCLFCDTPLDAGTEQEEEPQPQEAPEEKQEKKEARPVERVERTERIEGGRFAEKSIKGKVKEEDFEVPVLDAPDLEIFSSVESAASALSPSSRVRLPRDLAKRFSAVRDLRAGGTEPDLLIVETVGIPGYGQRVLKIYRPGARPNSELFMRLSKAGAHVVKLHEYGVVEGLSWELMEYCATGNLREVLKSRMPDRQVFMQLVRELAAGVEEAHALKILHRDLRPENVLVRQRQPLSLALTGFCISPPTDNARHFADTTRTVKYAAPEALTGVLDNKADWWSVGMLLLEIAAGKHPFDGLSEQAATHHLTTRPVEITGIADKGIAALCRGLLLRNPVQRWGAKEVARWLAGDTTLSTPIETGANLVRPYLWGKKRAYNAVEIATMLATSSRGWQDGIKDMKHGLILEWVKDELKDFSLARNIVGIMDTKGESDGRKFLRFLIAAAPELPPCWWGMALTRQNLLQVARLAYAFGTSTTDEANNQKAQEAMSRLAEIYDEDVLKLWGDAGSQDLAKLNKAWRQTLSEIHVIWDERRKAWQAFQQSKKTTGGNYVNFDNAVYGRDNSFNFPALRLWHPMIVLALTRESFLAALEKETRQVALETAENAPWFSRLANPEKPLPLARHIAGALVAARLANLARASGGGGKKPGQQQSRPGVRRGGLQQEIQKMREEFAPVLTPFLDADTSAERLSALRQAFAPLHAQVGKILALENKATEFITFSRQVETLAQHGDRLEAALDAVEQAQDINRIFSNKNTLRLLAGVAVCVAVIFFFVAPVLILLFAGIAGAAVFWGRNRRATSLADFTRQHKIFRRLCEKFLQPG